MYKFKDGFEGKEYTYLTITARSGERLIFGFDKDGNVSGFSTDSVLFLNEDENKNKS
jgi:hypothetical protein